MQDSSSAPVASSLQPSPIGVASIPCVLLAVRHRCLANGATQVNTAVVQIILNHTYHHTCYHTSVRGAHHMFSETPQVPNTNTSTTHHSPPVGRVCSTSHVFSEIHDWIHDWICDFMTGLCLAFSTSAQPCQLVTGL